MNTQRLSQKKFHEFVSGLTEEEASVYQNVIAMVYTLIEDKRLVSLHKLIKENYPEYYND